MKNRTNSFPGFFNNVLVLANRKYRIQGLFMDYIVRVASVTLLNFTFTISIFKCESLARIRCQVVSKWQRKNFYIFRFIIHSLSMYRWHMLVVKAKYDVHVYTFLLRWMNWLYSKIHSEIGTMCVFVLILRYCHRKRCLPIKFTS